MNSTSAVSEFGGGYNARLEALRLMERKEVNGVGRSRRLYAAARELGAGNVRPEEAIGALKRAWGPDDPAWERAATVAAWALRKGVKSAIAEHVTDYTARWAVTAGKNAAVELDGKLRRIADAAIFTSPTKLDKDDALAVVREALSSTGFALSEGQLADLEDYVESEVRARDLRRPLRRPTQKVQVLDPVAIAAEAFSNIVILSDRRPAWA